MSGSTPPGEFDWQHPAGMAIERLSQDTRQEDVLQFVGVLFLGTFYSLDLPGSCSGTLSWLGNQGPALDQAILLWIGL